MPNWGSGNLALADTLRRRSDGTREVERGAGIPAGPLEGCSADLVTDEAIDWLRDGRDPEAPFFLFVCYHEPHEPVATAERFTRLYGDIEDPAERALWGNVTQLDAGFGRLMAELDSQGLREDTLVFFTSDNGPALTAKHPYGSAGPLRAKKGHLWEGGIRVPGLLRWPGETEAGSVSFEGYSGWGQSRCLCRNWYAPSPLMVWGPTNHSISLRPSMPSFAW